jgi:hypothetical protein
MGGRIIADGKLREWKSLATGVIAVASVTQDVGDWAGYIDAVPGVCHEEEWEAAMAHGEKLPQAVASAIWPHLAAAYKWRD